MLMRSTFDFVLFDQFFLRTLLLIISQGATIVDMSVIVTAAPEYKLPPSASAPPPYVIFFFHLNPTPPE